MSERVYLVMVMYEDTTSKHVSSVHTDREQAIEAGLELMRLDSDTYFRVSSAVLQ